MHLEDVVRNSWAFLGFKVFLPSEEFDGIKIKLEIFRVLPGIDYSCPPLLQASEKQVVHTILTYWQEF